MLCAFTTTAVAEEVDYTSSIVNADLSTTDAWNTEGTKGISGGVVKVGSGSSFDFSQTITIPAGHYKMTAKAAYRYGANEQEEYDAIQAGANTHLAKLYAQTAAQTFEVNVFNRYEGASETDYAAGSGSATVNGLFVPNSSDAVKDWFKADQYVNVLEFDVLEDGDVKIGIVKTESAASGDYANIGAWTLTRTGDAQNTGEGEGDDTNTIDVDKTSLVGTSRDAWNAPLGPVTIDGISMPEKYETTTETTGDVMWQTVTGLDNGTYTVELYANARYTPGRGFDSPVTDGAMDCTFLFANDVELSIPVVFNADLNNGQSYKLEGVEVTDGTLRMGMTKKAAGSNWHTIQIKSLTWHTSGDAALTDAKNALQALIDETKAVSPAIESLTEAIATAEAALAAATTVEDVEAAQAALQAAYDAAADQIAYNKNVASVAGASATNPIVTNFVVNGTFDTNGETSPWKTTTGAQNQTTANNQAGAFTGNFFENWNPSSYTGKIFQTIENIPNGVYELSICAFVNNFDASCQYVYANDAKTYLTTGAPTAYTVLAEVTNNTIEIGFEQTTAVANWAGIDNASLTYYGPGTLAELAALVTYNSALAAANEAAEKDMLPSVKEALEAVIAANSNVDKADLAALTAAAEALNDAVVAATPSIMSYEVLANGVPNNSLDGWTCTNTNTFQVNTWSTEADNTGMVTPFIENWVGRPGPLGVGKVYYTMKDIAPGSYRVSALIRVYSESGAEPAGANFFAGDQTVDVTTGTAFTYNGMKGIYSNYSAVATVGEDGVLTFGLDITAPTFNWVAIKDVKVMKYHTSSNLDFSESTPIDNHICTYEKDEEKNGTTYSQMQPVTEWDFGVANGDAVAAGVYAYGGTPWIAGAGFLAPATNPEGVAEGNALGALACWGATVQYTQKVTLTPGNYVLTIPVYNSGAGVKVPSKSLIGFIADNGTEYLAPAKAYASDAWTTEVITFSLNEVTNGVLTLGYTSSGDGGGANQHLFFDCVKIETVSDAEMAKTKLAEAIAAAQATVDAKTGVGDGVFMIPTAAYDTYAAAVATAQGVYDNAEATAEELNAAIETLAAAGEAYAAAKVLPAAGKTYQIMHQEAGTFLTLNAGVKVEAQASPLSFVDAGDGKYYIANANGEYAYYSGTGNNNWSLNVSVDNKEAWTIAAVGDGVYTIKGKNGFLGTDAATAGSTCYGNKAATNWVIAEYAMPEMEVTLINPAGETAEKMVEGDFIKFTTNIEPGYILVGVLQVNDATQESEYLTSYRSAVKGETDWSVELYSTMKFREGHTYKFEFTAYESEDAYNQEPYDAPGSAAIGSDTVVVKGALPAYVYATATLNDIKPAYGSVIESETDNVVTLTFSEPVKVVYAQNLQSAGMMMPPTVNELTPVAVEADENGLATVWTVEMPLTPGFANISFAAEDAEGRRVWGNQGEEEDSYFSYEWQCTVGIPDVKVAPAGYVAGPVSTLTVTCAEQIDPYMGGGVVLNAAGEEVATIVNMEKVVDESLEMWTPEWNEAMATAPVTITLSNEITEPGTYTVKLDAGLFMLNSGAYNSKATEATFAIIPAENLVEMNVERIVNLGYAADVVDVDLAAICEKLGIASISEATVWGVNATTLEYVADAMTEYDGWRNAEGDFTKWGNNHQVCYKYIADGAFQLCTEGGNEPAVGTEYTAYWAFSTASDTVVLKTNITFVAAPEVEIEIVKTITVNHYEKPNTSYSGNTATFDVNEVTEALGITSITEAEQYIMNVTDGSLVKNSTDGWRGANGDALGWGNPGGVCVKINDPASGIIDYIGCYDNAWNEGDSFVAKWAFVYEGKAVVIEVVIDFNTEMATGINGISAGDVVKTQYIGINGAVLNAPAKGVNIVKQTLKNGKVVTSKVYVK